MEKLIFTNATLLRANQCEKFFYLNLHYPELKDEIKGNEYSSLGRRKIVEKLLKHLFPEGKNSGIDITGSCELSSIRTKKLINSNTRTIFNACFNHEEMFCFADVLHKENNRWSVFEIWDESDSINSIYLTATYQRYIIQKCGVETGSISSIVYHPKRNNENKIDLSYEVNSLDIRIKNFQNNLLSLIEKTKNTAKQDTIPDVVHGKHCTVPQKCDYYNYCKFSCKS